MDSFGKNDRLLPFLYFIKWKTQFFQFYCYKAYCIRCALSNSVKKTNNHAHTEAWYCQMKFSIKTSQITGPNHGNSDILHNVIKVPWKHKGLSIRVSCFQRIKKYYLILFSVGIWFEFWSRPLLSILAINPTAQKMDQSKSFVDPEWFLFTNFSNRLSCKIKQLHWVRTQNLVFIRMPKQE